MLFKRKYVYRDPAGSEGAPDGGGAPPAASTPPVAPGAGDTPPAAPAAPPQGAAPATPPQGAAPAAPPQGAAPTESFWKDDWREQYAGGDAKRLKELQRYTSPKAALDGLFAAKQRISSGQLAPVLKPNATEAEIAEYRASLGIPEKPDGYEIKLGDGRAVDEADKPMLDALVARLHSSHARPEQVNAVVEAFYDIEDKVLQEQEQSDMAARQATEDTLRAEWGGDYRQNVAAISGLLDAAPSGVKDLILGARNAEGITLLNDPQVCSWLASLSRQINPVASLVPGSTNPQQSVTDELSNIKKMMGDYNSDYWKGPKSAQLQERFRQLTAAMQKAA